MPEAQLGSMNNTVGNDYQAMWHQQKMRDANHMANAKVLATQVARAKAFSSPNGYYMLPPPVLGQRRFANASFGAQYTHTTREDVPGLAPWSEVQNGNPYASRYRPVDSPTMTDFQRKEHLSGGVLRTTVGQEWAKAKLNDRINQFNAIDQAKAMFQTDDIGGLGGVPAQASPFAGAEPSIAEELSMLPQVELAQLLQNVVDALTTQDYDFSGITKFLVGDANKIFTLCVRLATYNSADDIMNALEFIEGGSSQGGITQLLQNAIATYHEMYEGDPNPHTTYVFKILQSMNDLFSRLELYLKQMLKLVGNPQKDRVSASKALIKSLGFTKLIKDDAQLFAQVGNANTEVLAYSRANPLAPGQAQKSQSGAFIQPTGTEEAPLYFPHSHRGADRGNRYNQKVGSTLQERETQARYEEDHFTQNAVTREDSQMGYIGTGGLRFSTDYRGAFGDQSGRFINTVEAPSDENQYNTGGRDIGYMNATEAVAEEGEDEEGEEAEALAQASADTSSAIPHMRSQRDPQTGAWNLGLNEESPQQQPPMSPPPTTPARAKPYSEANVPRDLSALKQFVAGLRGKHPGYNQVVYDKAGVKPQNVRRHTIRKMAEHGLL
jgi:hypothetical protein